MKNFYILFLILSTFCAAQKDRVQIKGVISSVDDKDLGGITVFNINSYEGTVTNEGGTFFIDVKEGDQLDFRSVQFSNFKLVAGIETITSRKLKINLEESINELDEVRLSNGSFMISVRRTVAMDSVINQVSERNIRVAAVNRKENILSDRVRQPSEYGIRNEAFKQTQPRIDFFDAVGLAKGVINGTPLDGSDTGARALPKEKEAFDVNIVKNKYGTEYLVDYLKIEEEHLYEFLYFARDRGLDESYLTPEKELALLQFLNETSELYKKQKKQ